MNTSNENRDIISNFITKERPEIMQALLAVGQKMNELGSAAFQMKITPTPDNEAGPATGGVPRRGGNLNGASNPAILT